LNYFFELSKTTSVSISYLCASLALFNIYINHNTAFYKDWKIDSDVTSMMQNLVLEHEKYPNKNIRLGINWLFEPGVNFYRYTWDLKWLTPAHRRGISKYDDYFYILITDKEYMDLSNKPVVYKNEQTGAVLLKNTN
jgi:hypothetical protein